MRASMPVSGGAWILCFVMFALSAHAAQAQRPAAAAVSGPFAALAGNWAGSGLITLSSGTKERLRCRANYNPGQDGNALALALRCASDSYKFELRGNAAHRDGGISGNWMEATRNAAGQIIGRVVGSLIQARAEGQTFAALLSMNTQGNRQSISITSPGSELADVTISLTRRND